MKKLAVFLSAMFFVLSHTQTAYSVPHTCKEIQDAGELIDTAQITRGKGSLDYISGWLTGYNDIDMYQIYINDAGAFSVIVEADFVQEIDEGKIEPSDNDAMLFLFDSGGYPVIENDDYGGSALPQFELGQISGMESGIYYLALSLFNTRPNNMPYDQPFLEEPLNFWNSAAGPYPKTGPYLFTLTGASPAAPAPVPEPATVLLLGSGLIGLAGIRKRFSPDIS